MLIQSGWNVLLIEDNEGDYLLIEEYILEELPNASVVKATSLNEATSIINEKKHFDVILLDLSLPDGSGEELVKDILERVCISPVIVLTGYSEKDFSIKTLSWGVSDYLLKDELTPTLLHKSIAYSIERNNNRISLKKSEENYKNLFYQNPMPMWVYDIETLQFVNVNNAAINSYGYSKDEFLNLTLYDIRPEEDKEILSEHLKMLSINNEFNKGFYRHKKKNGDVIFVSIESNLITFNGKPFRLVLANDITEKVISKKKLIESEKQYSHLIQNLPVAVYTCDSKGFVTLYNKAAVALWGREPHVGKDKWCGSYEILDAFGVKVEKDDCPLAKLYETQRQEEVAEVIIQRPDGSQRSVVPHPIPIFDESGKLSGAINMLIDITEKKQQQKNLAKAIVKTQESERFQIGSDLHDNVNQILAGAVITLGLTKKHSTSKKQIEIVARATTFINDAIVEIRRLSHQLAPGSFNGQNLEEAFGNLLNSFNIDNRYQITFNIEQQKSKNLDKDLQLNLYRILQEQLNNIHKHAKANNIELYLIIGQQWLNMSISDNGDGFDISEQKEGIGLYNIRKRVELFSGSLFINSAPKKGCEIIIQIPL